MDPFQLFLMLQIRGGINRNTHPHIWHLSRQIKLWFFGNNGFSISFYFNFHFLISMNRPAARNIFGQSLLLLHPTSPSQPLHFLCQIYFVEIYFKIYFKIYSNYISEYISFSNCHFPQILQIYLDIFGRSLLWHSLTLTFPLSNIYFKIYLKNNFKKYF